MSKKSGTEIVKDWTIKISGSNRTVGSYPTQKAAVKAGEVLARKEKVNVIIYERRSTRAHKSLISAANHSRTSARKAPKKDPAIVGRYVRTKADVPPIRDFKSRRTIQIAARPKSRYIAKKSPSSRAKAKAWSEWVESHERSTLPLSIHAISRESIYEDHG